MLGNDLALRPHIRAITRVIGSILMRPHTLEAVLILRWAQPGAGLRGWLAATLYPRREWCPEQKEEDSHRVNDCLHLQAQPTSRVLCRRLFILLYSLYLRLHESAAL